MASITVNADMFHAVSLAMSHEETRYYLNGVYVHAHHTAGAFLVATDGHRLICGHDAKASLDKAMILPMTKQMLAALKDAKKAFKNFPSDLFRFRFDGNSVAILVDTLETGHVLPCKAIDGSFPDYTRVIPKEPVQFERTRAGDMIPRHEFCGFNPEYLLDFSRASQIVTGDKSAHITLAYNADADEPALVRMYCNNMFGVIMPMRSHISRTDVLTPAWFPVPQSVAVAAE